MSSLNNNTIEELLNRPYQNKYIDMIKSIQIEKWRTGKKRDRTEYTISLIKDYLPSPLNKILPRIGRKLSALIDTLDDLVDNISSFSREQYLRHLVLQELLGFELLRDVSYIENDNIRKKVANILYDWVYKLVQIPLLERHAIEIMNKGLCNEGIKEFYNARVYGTLAHIKLATEFLPVDEKDKKILQKLFSYLRQIESILDDLTDVEEDMKRGIYTPAILCTTNLKEYLNNLIKELNTEYFENPITKEIHRRIKEYTHYLLSIYQRTVGEPPQRS